MRLTLAVIMICCCSLESLAEPPAKGGRLSQAQLNFTLSSQPTGLLIPLYLYPANVHTNPVYNRLIELKLQYPRVPVCVIVNPADGPGKEVDGNHKEAIRRLSGAGCVVLGYVSTRYGKQPITEVRADIKRWTSMYQDIGGIFLDEQSRADEKALVDYYVDATRTAHDEGFWPVFANPGTNQIEKYFTEPTADVIVVHENESYPDEKLMRGDYFGGHADFPPYRRAALVHSQAKENLAEFKKLAKYTRWIYVTDDEYRVNDPKAQNPWDSLSKHTARLFEMLKE